MTPLFVDQRRISHIHVLVPFTVVTEHPVGYGTASKT